MQSSGAAGHGVGDGAYELPPAKPQGATAWPVSRVGILDSLPGTEAAATELAPDQLHSESKHAIMTLLCSSRLYVCNAMVPHMTEPAPA